MARPKPRKARSKPLTVPTSSAGVPFFPPTPERLARGDFQLEDQVEHVYSRDATGERARGRKVVTAQVFKDRRSDLRTTLARQKGLGPDQLAAALRLEAEWNLGGLEPRTTANMESGGGGVAGSGAKAPQDYGRAIRKARDSVHGARKALERGGREMARIVEAVVFDGASASTAGSAKYRDPLKGAAHAAAMLDAGLAILAAHYAAYDRETAERVRVQG